jgi:hypothetical protein
MMGLYVKSKLSLFPMVALEISHCTNVTLKYGDLALQVGGVSDVTVK